MGLSIPWVLPMMKWAEQAAQLTRTSERRPSDGLLEDYLDLRFKSSCGAAGIEALQIPSMLCVMGNHI